MSSGCLTARVRRVIDWALADRVDAAGNVLVVESVADRAAR